MKGAPPLFSCQLLGKMVIVVIIAFLVGFPVFHVYPNRAQGADPTYSVAIIDYSFQPLHINITTGTMVVWTYASTGRDYHTVTSNPGTNKTQGGMPLLNSGSLSPGQSFTYTFNQPGYYPYQCSFHPTLMNGWVNVTGSPITPPPSQNPQPNNSLIIVGVGVVAAVIVATVVLFVSRRNRKTSVAPAPTQKANP